MMTDTLREIEKGHEAKYKLDEELRFKVRCRRDKLLGLWAAERMGMVATEAESYAKSLVRLGLERPGATVVVQQVLGSFQTLGLPWTERDIATALDRFHSVALEQLAKDFPRALDTDHVQIGG